MKNTRTKESKSAKNFNPCPRCGNSTGLVYDCEKGMIKCELCGFYLRLDGVMVNCAPYEKFVDYALDRWNSLKRGKVRKKHNTQGYNCPHCGGSEIITLITVGNLLITQCERCGQELEVFELDKM